MTLTLDEWNDIIMCLEEIYGCVCGCCGRDDGLPQNEAELEDAWFICPECGEPIYYHDYNEELANDSKCPVCDFEFEFEI